MLSVDVELNRIESELQQEESALHTELARLSAVGQELARKLEGVRHAASEAAGHGVRDGALDGRLKTATVPEVDPESPFMQARVAREAAVKARKAANQAARGQVAAFKQQLTALSNQLQGDAKAAEKLGGLVRQKQRAEADDAMAQTLKPNTVAAVQPPPPPPMAFTPSQVPSKAAAKPIGRMSAPQAPAAKPPQRHSQRVQMQAMVDLSSDNNFFNGFSSNISDGGLFVATVNLQPIGTEIDVTFTLPAGEKIVAHGVVRWVRMVDDKHPESFPGLGIQFTRLEAAAQEAINEFVASREPMFYVE
jgi:uncharacterized protein (TIGR02266 family)